MKRGIFVFDHCGQEWRICIGQQSYWIRPGYTFELRIQNGITKLFWSMIPIGLLIYLGYFFWKLQ